MRTTLSVTAYAVPAPPRGGAFCIFRSAQINLPLSGEVASRSDDGEGLPQETPPVCCADSPLGDVAFGMAAKLPTQLKGVPLGESTLSVCSRWSQPAPPRGGAFCIFRSAQINLPLSGEVASRSDDGEGSTIVPHRTITFPAQSSRRIPRSAWSPAAGCRRKGAFPPAAQRRQGRTARWHPAGSGDLRSLPQARRW